MSRSSSFLLVTASQGQRRAFLQALVAACALPVRAFAGQERSVNAVPLVAKAGGYHVYPKGQIQEALDAAARDPVNKTVYVHAGTYRPAAKGQALVWFNERHDGITLEAVGDVTLTAANPEIADAAAPSYPAVVNHVVYFGDGLSPKTTLRGFKITGANNFTTGSGEKSPIESDDDSQDGVFLHRRRWHQNLREVLSDGGKRGGVRNYTSPCGGGVSVEHLGQMQDWPDSGTASSATTGPDHRDPRLIFCTAAGRRSKTACSSETSPTWASTMSGC